MDATMIVVSVIGVLLTGGCVIAAGVWCVGRITASVDSLSSKVDGLGGQVHELTTSVHELDNKLDGHADRLARLEERVST